MPNSPAWAFVTPSYSGDYERCLLLCRSMDAFLSGNWHHYVVVDAPDFAQFKSLASSRRSVLLTHDVVPKGLRHLFNLPFARGRSLWWSAATGFMIGWHLQQIVKIAMATRVESEGLAFCDSDVFLVRPFDVSTLVRGGRFRMYRSHHPEKLNERSNPNFTRNALDILGIADNDTPHYDYVDNFVTWHRPTVLAMCAHIERNTGRSWHAAFGKRLQISEYALYGLFVDNIELADSRIFRDSVTLCRTQWTGAKLARTELKTFWASMNPAEVAIGIQSFAGVDVADLNAIFEEALAGSKSALKADQ